VPYPFGIGPARCSAAPGFNLTCVSGNTTTRPRLLLGDDGVLEVKAISLENRTVRVISPPIFSNAATNISASVGWRGDRGLGDERWQYSLAPSSELVVAGCNVQVTLLSTTPGGAYGYAAGCSSLCNDTAADHVLSAEDVRNYSGGFCIMPVFAYLSSYAVEVKRLHTNGTAIDVLLGDDALPVYVLLAETGWFDPDRAVQLMGLEKPLPKDKDGDLPVPVAPLVLDWSCINDGSCNASVSANTNCTTGSDELYYVCNCTDGYEGNPYLTHGCQGIYPSTRSINPSLIKLLFSIIGALLLKISNTPSICITEMHTAVHSQK
jgi:hypothetical protein